MRREGKERKEERGEMRFSETDHRTTREDTDLHRVSRSTHLITKEFAERKESHDLFFFLTYPPHPTDLCRSLYLIQQVTTSTIAFCIDHQHQKRRCEQRRADREPIQGGNCLSFSLAL